MEDDNNEGPFSVWQMLNAPTLMLFDNNIEYAADGLDRLLTSILKLSGDSDVLVARPGATKYPDTYYAAFNTWLLGRLFYVCSIPELTKIHILSKDAQLKILNILSVNSAPFYKKIHSQYFLILMSLLEYYKHLPDSNKQKLKLEYFTPVVLSIPNVDINLNPIYVEVKDTSTCKMLIKFILQLLSESIPFSILQTNNRELEDQVFTCVLNAIRDYSMDIKYMGLHFYLNLIKNMNNMSITKFHDTFPMHNKTLLCTLEALVQNMNIFYDKCEIDNVLLNNLNTMLLEFLRVIDFTLESQSKEILTRMSSVILSKTSSKVFKKKIKSHCLLLSNMVELPKDLINMSDMDPHDIEKVSECYCNKIVYDIQINNRNKENTNLHENWYYARVLTAIDSIKTCELSNTDKFLIEYYLQKCQKSLAILERVACKVKMLLNDDFQSNEILTMQNIKKIWDSLIQIQQQHKLLLLQNQNSFELLINITISTINLSSYIARVDMSMILHLLCLYEIQPSEKYFPYNEHTKLKILRSLLVAKLHIKPQNKDMDSTILVLYNLLLKNKDVIKEIVQLCPLLVLTKSTSATKVMGDILNPIFIRNNIESQKAVLKALLPIACITLGTHDVVISDDESVGQVIYKNSAINICLLCTKCHTLTKSPNNETMSVQIRKEFKLLHNESNSITPVNLIIYEGLKELFGNVINSNVCYGHVEFWDFVQCLSNHYCIFNFNISMDIVNEKYFNESLNIFKPFMDDTQVTKYPEWNSQRDTITNLYINILVNSTRTCLQNKDYNLQSQTLDYIKDLGLCHNTKLILPITKLLIFFIMHPQCSLAPKAVIYLREVCEFHKLTPNQVYHRYKKDICKLFVECSLYNGKDFFIYLLKVVKAFGFIGYRDFISKDIHHFLPYLVPYAIHVKEVPSMIEETAALVQCSLSDFLIERFPHVYVHVYLHESESASNKCYEIIENLTKMTTLNLIKRHFRIILTEFLLQYCTNPEKVLNACRHLACHDPDTSTSQFSATSVMSTAQIADFLNPKFLGVLAYFDQKLINAKVALSVKRKALKSFPDIMQLMGAKYLTPLRFKVLATLRSALPLAKEFPIILADAWGAFIYNIDSICLGALLSNLAVSLLQQFEYAPQEINKIFQYLILNNENILSSNIPDLFFVLDSNISHRVTSVINKHVKRTEPRVFLDKIKWYLRHLNHDIPKIKAHVFMHLDKLLRTNRSGINKAIFNSKNIDSVIVELIDSLLIGCKDPDVEVARASGSCLGQLGAVEAGHLPRQYLHNTTPFAFSINDNCFVAAALAELTRAFQYEKDTINMDSYALTIQEILKVYDISPTGSKKDLWDSFPENMHQIMFPLLNSRYTLAYPSQPKEEHPLFGSVYATTFLEWAYNWAGQLVARLRAEGSRALLRAALPSMRRDARTLTLFLPYVLLHAALAQPDYVRAEILAVIKLANIETETPVASDGSKCKILRHTTMTPNINSVQTEEGNQGKCSKTVYMLLDFLNRWLLEWIHVKPKPLENENYKSIKSFVDSFDKLVITRGNLACGELERALQYLELYMDENKDQMQEHLPLLAEIYALLDEPDSLAGILSIKKSELSLKELILTQVVTGRLQDAALCYERLAQEGQLDRHSLQGMIDCYLGLDQPFTAYRLLSEHESNDMRELTAEPLWRLGRFDPLEELVSKPVPPSRENWGLLMGRILLAYRKQDNDNFKITCDDAKNKLFLQMDTQNGGESALKSGYQSVLGLHIIAEVEHAERVLRRLKELNDNSEQGTEIINQLLGDWRFRLSVVQSDVRTVEPLLRLRRILLQQTKESLEPTHPITANNLKKHIGELWLQSAEQARKAGIIQQAYMYILNAEEYRPEQLFIEKAEMYWARGQHEHAFTTLRRGLADVYPATDALLPAQRKKCAKAKLLIAKYNDETTKVDVDVNIGYYKESVEVFKQWEKSLVCLGLYYEKASNSDSAANTETMWARRLYALNSYGMALQYGHKYLYQSMPRMLSIWLDIEVTSTDKNVHSVLVKMTEIVKTFSERLPIYLYLTAFSQIVSRICHPVKEVYQQLKAIIVKLILAYPQQTLWMMMCVIKSSYPQRIKRCSDVFSEPSLKKPHMLKLLNDFEQLAGKLIELCNKPIVSTGSTTTVSSLVRTLPRLLASEGFSQIMMPFQQFVRMEVPKRSSPARYCPAPTPAPAVHIAGIDETVTILPSLQKPRKVTLRGSDGKAYIIMLKPRDDLRKDFRLMEFNTVVNRLLQDAPETRRRRLYIRTYSVLALNEECGIIEWVPNLVGLRPVLIHIYKQKGLLTSNRELKEMMCSKKDSYEKKRRIYEKQLLPRHPPVFQEWFRRVFSDPYGWYQARSAYIRTTAVMSMVGYILGLGDRHGENVSFDSTNGDTVHVDFNCLFNKGESYEWPERVPFRLTHNMEAAMGPLKHEGMYRKSCEEVMRVLRSQTETLMSVIGPFVYDPLVSWVDRSDRNDRSERTNDQALQHLQHIRMRLNGMVKTKNKQLSLSLSPEGQVEHLIAEATSVQNLCQMYIGWGPFL